MLEMNRCMKCMHILEGGWAFCPDCGYDNQHQSNSERALSIGSILNGKYLIGAVLGEGGFGITYAAWDMLIETRIAIKEYFPSELVTRDTTLSEENSGQALTLIQERAGESRYREGLARFVKEAGNLAKFQKYPGIVSVKDFFYENNTAYMVMEYIDGVTLNSYLESHNEKLGKEETFRMMEPVMKTLEAIHKEGIIHRDISPDNIMVTADGQMKLIDFGAARFVGADDEKSLTVILKHGYAPEEQYRSNGEQGSWTDVYALSAVIYRMLTGKVPEETLKRMAEKQDSIHVELGEVSELSAAERKSLEKGLAVKAGRRYQTIDVFCDGIYGKKKQNIRKWVAGAGLAAVVVLCMIVVGMVRVKNKDAEEKFLEAENTQEVIYDNGLESAKETEELIEQTEPEEIEEAEVEEEPENIRALREYYNDNGFWQFSKPIFTDLTGDGNDEMIVAQEQQTTYNTTYFEVVVYQYKDSGVEAIYRTEDTKWMYYLFVGDDSACILKKFINVVDSDGWGDYTTEKVIYEKIFLEDTENGITYDAEYSDGEMESLITKSVLLMNARGGALFWSEGEKLADYQSVLEHRESLGEALEIAESVQKPILDYAAVYDEGNRCTFAFAGEADVSYEKREMDINGTWSETWGAVFNLGDEIFSVYAFHDGQVEEVEAFNPDEEFDWGYSGDWESKIYQFGKVQHYILELSGTEQWVQHKFCYEDRTARKTDDNRYFEKDENGKVRMLIAGYPSWEDAPGASDGILNVTTLVDVFYYDHQYVEYGAEEVDISDLEQYENYREILQEAEENLLKVTYIAQPQEFIIYEKMEKAQLIYVRKSVNGIYYLNYKIYGKMAEDYYESYGNTSEVAKEPDADGNYGNTVWAHVVLEASGNRLKIENQYSGEKGEQSETGLAIYYGPDRELKPSGKAKSELGALIEEKSGKYIVAGSRGCYEDYDGNGKYELFAFVADSPWPYLKNYILRSDRVSENGKETTGCALWFSDGEQTVQVAELADGYCEFSMDVFQFGESMQCSLTRLKPNKYLSIDEVLSADGYATTVCVLENGNPRVVMQDENIRFYEKEDSKEIGCYGPYGTWRPDDSVLYKNGGYYWKSDSTPIISDINYRTVLTSVDCQCMR